MYDTCECGERKARKAKQCRKCWRENYKPANGWGGYHGPNLQRMSNKDFISYVRLVKAELERRKVLRNAPNSIEVVGVQTQATVRDGSGGE